MIVKFGGSSLADERRRSAAARKIAALHARGEAVVAVVSAPGDLTDRLASQILLAAPEPDGREADAVLSIGEQLSAGLMALSLQSLHCAAESFTGARAGIVTDGVFGNAAVVKVEPEALRACLARGTVAVVAGFQGVDAHGNVTTLGRGGSDTTAVALAAALGADECRIYTDVDGVYDRDPRVYSDARRLERVDYETMLKMARAGAQVLHERSVALAAEKGVRIRVLSSFRAGGGTLVG